VNMRARRVQTALRVAVGLLLAAVVPCVSGAQVRTDTTRRDSTTRQPPVSAGDSIKAKARADSVERERILARTDSIQRALEADTLRPPLPRFELPASTEITDRLRLTREEIMSSGAVNLADLLDRVPGVTTYRSGWVAGLHVASVFGEAQRLRLFVDGVELDPLDARGQGTEDLTDIPLWPLDELVIERTAGEVRVWMRSSTVTKTIPYTRVDVFTGDLNTNAFRGLFARRWRNGMSLQLGGQQIATQTGRVSAFGNTRSTRVRSDGTVQGINGRVGWSRGRLGIDAWGNAVTRERDGHTAREGFTDLTAYKGARREGYLRVGYGDTARGWWSHAIVQALRTKLDVADTSESAGGTGTGTDDDSTTVGDSIASRTQQLVAVGYRGGWWNASLTDRVRLIDGARRHAPALRAGLSWRAFDLGTWIERNGRDSTDRQEFTLRARPLPWMRVVAAHATRTPEDSLRRTSSSLRTEAAVRWRGLWWGGGIVRDGAADYANIPLLGTPARPMATVAAQAIVGSVVGRLYKDVHLDAQVMRWDVAKYNRPSLQVRTELALISDWRRRFPKGEFGINARLIYDRRASTPFLYGVDTDPENIRVAEVAQVITALLEIRIQRGTLFYQYRNLTGGQYEQIRGITMPPAVQMYGLRWEFWN